MAQATVQILVLHILPDCYLAMCLWWVHPNPPIYIGISGVISESYITLRIPGYKMTPGSHLAHQIVRLNDVIPRVIDV